MIENHFVTWLKHFSVCEARFKNKEHSKFKFLFKIQISFQNFPFSLHVAVDLQLAVFAAKPVLHVGIQQHPELDTP